MFVRSRASRTRAERPIPGDRVLDAFDRALIGAHGAALDLVAAYLSRAGTLEADESGRTPGILAVTAAEGRWPRRSRHLLNNGRARAVFDGRGQRKVWRAECEFHGSLRACRQLNRQ